MQKDINDIEVTFVAIFFHIVRIMHILKHVTPIYV